MFEVEAKFRLRNPARLRRRLRELGATLAGRHREDDLYFDFPGRKAGQILRVRHQGRRYEITYKGLPQSGPRAKVRQEENLFVDSDPTPLLRLLGFHPGHRVSKLRITYRVDPATVVTIDSVQGLGLFAEVEALGQGPAAASEKILALAERLGLAENDLERRSYLEMVSSRQRRPAAGTRRGARSPGQDARAVPRRPA